MKRRAHQTATQTSSGFSQMAVMLQLLQQDFRLSQVDALTSQNLHSCASLTAPLPSVTTTSLLAAERRGAAVSRPGQPRPSPDGAVSAEPAAAEGKHGERRRHLLTRGAGGRESQQRRDGWGRGGLATSCRCQ